MKSIGRLKVSILLSSYLAYFLPVCRTEPFFSSKANITPVKLFHINPTNLSSYTYDHNAFGSKAKISRVVPLKHVSKVRQTNFKNVSHPVFKFGNHSNSSSAKKKSSAKLGSMPSFQTHKNKVTEKTVIKSVNVENNASIKQVPSIINSTRITTEPPPVSSKLFGPNPLYLTSDSWNYLNSAVTDDELSQIINGLSNEVIKNISETSKLNPQEGQKYLLSSIISELGNLKRSRMLALDISEKKNTALNKPVNKGVRFSAKQRKPVLNVIPLFEQKGSLGKPIKNLIKTGVVEQWNISGLISNDETDAKQDLPNGNAERRPIELENYPNTSVTTFKASPIFPGSTTPSLMQVLAVPDHSKFDSTTFSPLVPSQSMVKNGFVPVDPINNFMQSIHEEEINPKMENLMDKSKRIMEDEDSQVTSRNPRVPPKEDEYMIPPITSTSSSSPEVNKGYQTITESTTEGPKIIWYHHNQTPQDTFYPNSDHFLVPPEESSIEILADLLSVQHMEDDHTPSDIKKLYSPGSSELSFKYNDDNSKGNKKVRPVLHYSSKENDDDERIGTRKKESRFSIEKYNKKMNKVASLQQAATSDHDGIRDYFEDLDTRNDGSSEGSTVYRHHKRTRYGPESYNSIKHHEIIPRHQKTNRKPPLREDDTESYGAFNEADHYHDSYPPRPIVSKHEISPYRYRRYQHDSPDENDEYFKEEHVRTYDGGGNVRFKDDGPTTDSDFFYKKEPKYRLKETLPVLLSPYHGAHIHSHPGFGYQENAPGQVGHGWKDPSKDFFSKAKDYFKNSDFSTAEKWFDVTIGVLAFLAFGGYIIMLLYQVFAVSSGTSIGTLLGRSMRGAGEMFDLFFSKGPMGQAYLDELETIVKKAMANVKRIWLTNSFAEKKVAPKVKGETDAK